MTGDGAPIAGDVGANRRWFRTDWLLLLLLLERCCHIDVLLSDIWVDGRPSKTCGHLVQLGSTFLLIFFEMCQANASLMLL